MARNLSSLQYWIRRRRMAAVTGLLALFLQVSASLVPVSAMADMAAAEIGQLPLCTADSGPPTNLPAKSDRQDQLSHHCQICLSLQLLGTGVAPAETAAVLPVIIDRVQILPATDRVAATAVSAGFLSRAPPQPAKSLS